MDRRQFLGFSAATALVAATVRPRLGARAQAAYTATDLGMPDGFTSVTPIALNNNGVAVVSASSDDARAIFIVENGSFTQVGDPDEKAFASSINDANQVGGWIQAAGDGSGPNPDLPILFTPTGQLAMPGDQVEGRVYAVASDGRAVGEAAVDAGKTARRAVIWDNQEIAELKGAPGGGASAARDINTRGQIVGWIGTEDGSDRRAVMFGFDQDPTELGALGGSLSEAIAINEQGVVVGNATTSDDRVELRGDGIAAFSWADGTMNALPALDNQAWSTAADVNSFGLVAGTVGLATPATASAATIAVIWAPDSVLDLNQTVEPVAGLTLSAAVGVNELGQVLCAAIDAAGASHAVLLSVRGN